MVVHHSSRHLLIVLSRRNLTATEDSENHSLPGAGPHRGKPLLEPRLLKKAQAAAHELRFGADNLSGLIKRCNRERLVGCGPHIFMMFTSWSVSSHCRELRSVPFCSFWGREAVII